MKKDIKDLNYHKCNIMYQVEEKESRKCFIIICTTKVEYVWAYSRDEAIQICIDKGLNVLIK